MFTVRKALAATAIGALTIVPLAACSSEEASDTVDAATSSAAEAVESTPEPAAEVDNLTGVDTAVALDPGFTGALTTLGLTPGVVGTATLADGSIRFPITGGDVKYWEPGTVDPYVQGEINHDGSGLSLTAGETVVELTNFDIDPGTSLLTGDVLVNGEEAAADAVLFDLDGRTLQPLATGPDNTAILQGTQVKISETAAGLLNSTFNTDAVTPGLLVGVATITINTAA
ncbi:hypothetical protein CH306_06285 [Rhodococcus sp. 15-725-2-2b]|jgi:hypothetical protein|uniref:hypothetical protein n=1 Tax=unclassified Rhodococcus (in: high G+C Gram-positive bacteria) TaxID=192944 RepID=UPI0005DA0973|nr:MULTISPECIES: hypothetical protein [unclassified Rhodococcus (in: high G+C Gram-positive bacteria)]AJW41176.1 hypothetical protein NY08_3166 [Rhodococcus sp. B7740]OZC68111.1 hypothetical protein CH276_04055 [Rhodococcus sp. 06-470-2]OZC70092.1 hypothetical protein CH277_07475 [Rhodococcus sp. 06-469-3-2]OZC81398.1 hypothetical protein CH274_11325 [Rhodococcus sp. 06-418-5]OZD40460.1 hypothetical protein CH264_26290 [Rhodococcus sp. 06-1477-1A]